MDIAQIISGFAVGPVVGVTGSLPGIYLGSRLVPRIPEHLLRPALAGMPGPIGGKPIAA